MSLLIPLDDDDDDEDDEEPLNKVLSRDELSSMPTAQFRLQLGEPLSPEPIESHNTP